MTVRLPCNINIIVKAFIFYCRRFVIILVIVIMIAIIISGIITLFKTSSLSVYLLVSQSQPCRTQQEHGMCIKNLVHQQTHLHPPPPTHNVGRKCLGKRQIKCELSAETDVTSDHE